MEPISKEDRDRVMQLVIATQLAVRTDDPTQKAQMIAQALLTAAQGLSPDDLTRTLGLTADMAASMAIWVAGPGSAPQEPLFEWSRLVMGPDTFAPDAPASAASPGD